MRSQRLRLSFRSVALGFLGLAALLFGVGWAMRVPPSERPYLAIAGSGFVFNYRVADAFYGFTAVLQRPVRNFSRIEAEFEDPGGGPPIRVSQKVGPRTNRYGLRTPPVHGIEKDRPYRVKVRLVQNGDDAVLFEDSFTVASRISDLVMPPAPLTVGPGYAPNPHLPDAWKPPQVR